MKLKSDRKNYMIIALCAILLVMSIGYAAFSSLLTINGTASVSDSFCVGFDNTKTNTYAPTAGITNGTLPTGSMSYSGTACSTNYQPNSSLSATFKQPGDKIEYTLTIANKSTFTVAIESILVENQNVTSNTTITKGNIKYMVEMPLTTTLASNAETTMKITAMFQNDTNVTGQYNGESQTLNVKINAEQGDSGFTPTPAAFTGTIYRFNTAKMTNGSTIRERTIYNITSDGVYGHGPDGDYETFEECESVRISQYSGGMECKQFELDALEYTTDASTLNKTYYLKHDVEDDIITASYVCFVTDEEHCMKGGDNGASFATNTQMIQDYQAFYNLGLSSTGTGCNFNSSGSWCHGGSFENVSTYPGGGSNIGLSSYEFCDVMSDSRSYCQV